MLQQPNLHRDLTEPARVIVKSTTKANTLDMPFNRLEGDRAVPCKDGLGHATQAGPPPAKRRRTASVSEDDPQGLHATLPGLIAMPQSKPASLEIHPARVAMLQDPHVDHDLTNPTPHIVKSTTKANATDLPFNRLKHERSASEERMMEDEDLGPRERIRRIFTHRDPVRDQADAAREAADSIERFLQTLEPTITARTWQTEDYGRLSPVPQDIAPMVVDGNGQLTEEQFQAMFAADVPIVFTDGSYLPPIKKEPVIKQEPMD
jgi:hypothetical protein